LAVLVRPTRARLAPEPAPTTVTLVGSPSGSRSSVAFGRRAGRYALLLLLTLVLVFDLQAWAGVAQGGIVFPAAGMDLDLYLAATRTWLSGGSFYLPHQLTGPYPVEGLGVGHQPVLYPPTAILLFATFTFLPAVLYWTVPLLVVALHLGRQRPDPVSWLLIAVLALWPGSLYAILAGNPAMWVAALVALAIATPALSPWILLKPSLAPFALLHVTRRRWWVGASLLAAISLPFAPLWIDYAIAVANARSASGVLYSLPQVPLVAIPLVPLIPGAVARACEAIRRG